MQDNQNMTSPVPLKRTTLKVLQALMYPAIAITCLTSCFSSLHEPKKITSNQTTSVNSKKAPQTSTKQQAKGEKENKKWFKIKSGPPPGFEAAALENKNHTTLITVFFQDQYVANTMAQFNDKSITILDPKGLIAKIPNIKNGEALVQALNKKLNAHRAMLCSGASSSTTPYCSIPKVKTAAVVFNAQTLRMDLFVNADYVRSKDYIAPLGPSTSGFSILSNNEFNYVGTQEKSKDGTQSSKNFSWGNDLTLARGNTQANIDYNFTRNESDNGQVSQILNFNTITADRYNNGHLYQLGMLSPSTTGMVGAPAIAGFAVKNYGVLDNYEVNTGNAPPVYLTSDSTVSVYRGNALIYTDHLKAGKHLLDSRRFPDGSYNIKIVTVDRYNHQQTRETFFSKQPSIPSKGTHYQYAFGYMQDSGGFGNTLSVIATQQNKVNIPHFINVPIASYSEIRTLLPNLGIESNLLSDFQNLYFSQGLDYFFSGNNKIKPEYLVSSAHQYGIGSTMSMQYGHLGLNQTYRQMFGGDNKLNSQYDSPGFNPNIISKKSITSNVSYSNTWLGSLSLSDTYQQDQFSKTTRSYGFQYNRSLWSSSLTSAFLNFNVTKNTTDRVAVLGLNFSFNTQVLNFNSSYNSTHHSNQNSQHQGSFQVSKNMAWGDHQSASLLANYQKDENSDQQILSSTYNSNTQSTNVNISNSRNSDNSFVQVQADSNVTWAYTEKNIGRGNASGENAGVMINVRAPKDVKMKVFVNNSQMAIVKANHPQMINLSPYKHYQVMVMPDGDSFYQYNQLPKEVNLYAGNVQNLTWNLQQQYILFAHIVDQKNQPLKNNLLSNVDDFNSTDENGFIQANLLPSKQNLHFKSINGGSCTVHLAKNLKIDNNLLVMDKPLVCMAAHKDKKKTSHS